MGRHLLGLMRKMRVGDKFQAGVKSVCVWGGEGGGLCFSELASKRKYKKVIWFQMIPICLFVTWTIVHVDFMLKIRLLWIFVKNVWWGARTPCPRVLRPCKNRKIKERKKDTTNVYFVFFLNTTNTNILHFIKWCEQKPSYCIISWFCVRTTHSFKFCWSLLIIC